MAAAVIGLLLLAYVLWALRRIRRRKKKARGACCGCPYYERGLCRREAGRPRSTAPVRKK